MPMNSRGGEGVKGAGLRREPDNQPIVFVHRLAMSEGFKTLFREGMGLVEEAAAYLDNVGREESRSLPRAAALAYATESMRLTTRIMQLASWLLLQRAVNEGELTMAQAISEKHRVRLTRQDLATSGELFEQLPLTFQALCHKSLRLQQRILHLDASLTAARQFAPEGVPPAAIVSEVERVRAAFAQPA